MCRQEQWIVLTRTIRGTTPGTTSLPGVVQLASILPWGWGSPCA
jgi:hypothetical protein